MERILARIALKGTEVLQQQIPGLFNASYPVGILSLCIQFPHRGIVLCISSTHTEDDGI